MRAAAGAGPTSPAARPAGGGGAVGSQRLAVVADDLTGAADAAAPFAVRGAETTLVLGWPPPAGAQVLALVADSRWRDPRAAATRVGELVDRAREWGADRLFVKVDSTLRGHVGTEVAAALAAWGDATAVACPAFPQQGRVVRGGVLYVHGVARPGPVASAFPRGVAVHDAVDDEDLLGLARRVVSSGAIGIGSAGLARALAEVLDPGRPAPRRPEATVAGVLVAVGSTHPASRAQSAVLVEAGTACLVVGTAVSSDLEQVVDELAAGGRVLVTTELGGDVDGDGPRAQALAAELGSVVRTLLSAAPASALVVTGGSTALAVATALEARSLRLLDEIGPGVALGELLLADRPVPVITKSGGFGRPDALLRAVELLEECA